MGVDNSSTIVIEGAGVRFELRAGGPRGGSLFYTPSEL